ncbi:MAG: 2-C-methyl-D-erythritol 4-phosphate cytidylyltransferase [Ferruginibacter sp.]
MKKIAVIVGGGSGTRMKNAIPKQFLLLNGKPILFYTIETFLNSFEDLQIILVLPADSIAAGQDIVDTNFDKSRIIITPGGSTRFHSVQNGLKLIQDECIVFVHDAVRCLLTNELIHRCFNAVLSYGSAIPVIDCKDSLRLLTIEGNEAIDRETVKIVQTPQAFYSKILLPAFNIDYNEMFTDEAGVVEAFGLTMYLVEGEEQNIKITNPMDLVLAEKLLDERKY